MYGVRVYWTRRSRAEIYWCTAFAMVMPCVDTHLPWALNLKVATVLPRACLLWGRIELDRSSAEIGGLLMEIYLCRVHHLLFGEADLFCYVWLACNVCSQFYIFSRAT